MQNHSHPNSFENSHEQLELVSHQEDIQTLENN